MMRPTRGLSIKIIFPNHKIIEINSEFKYLKIEKWLNKLQYIHRVE